MAMDGSGASFLQVNISNDLDSHDTIPDYDYGDIVEFLFTCYDTTEPATAPTLCVNDLVLHFKLYKVNQDVEVMIMLNFQLQVQYHMIMVQYHGIMASFLINQYQLQVKLECISVIYILTV